MTPITASMKRMFALATMAAMMTMGAGSLQAQAWKSKQAVSSLNSALQYLHYANNSLKSGQTFAAKVNIRKAYYRVKMAGFSVNHQAIDVAAEKLSDRFLSPREQVFFGVDCILIALGDIIVEDLDNVSGARIALNAAKKAATKFYMFDQAVQLLRTTRPVLRRAGGQAVMRPVRVAIEKMTDSYLNREEKAYFAEDCLNIALSNI